MKIIFLVLFYFVERHGLGRGIAIQTSAGM